MNETCPLTNGVCSSFTNFNNTIYPYGNKTAIPGYWNSTGSVSRPLLYIPMVSSVGAYNNTALPNDKYVLITTITFNQTLTIHNLSVGTCGSAITPPVYSSMGMNAFNITCLENLSQTIPTQLMQRSVNATNTPFPTVVCATPRCTAPIVWFNETYITGKKCKYLKIYVKGNDVCNSSGFWPIMIGGTSGTIQINDVPLVNSITNAYTLFPAPLNGNIIASDAENDTIFYAYICDLYNTNVSTSTANIVNAQLNPSKLISDYNQPLDSNGAYACFGYSCSASDYLYDYCITSQSYGSRQYKQCPNTDEFRTTSYVATFENKQPYYAVRINENSSFFWLLSNVDASKELSWRAYPGWNPKPLTYAFLVWDSSYLLSLAYRWQYNSSNAKYVLYKTFAVNPATNDTFNESIGSFSLSSFTNTDSFLYPDMRFIMRYNYGVNISFYVQDTATNELLFIGIDNLSKNAFNQSFSGSNHRFSSIMFKPHDQATAFYAFKQNPIPINLQWAAESDYSCSYDPGTYTFRAFVTDSQHINTSYSYADFSVASDNIGAQAVSGIISRFVDFSDAGAVKRFLVIYQVFMIIAVLVVSLLIYWGVHSFLPEISANVFIGISLILLYVASLLGLLLAWTGVVCSIVFAVVITGFMIRNVSGGSQSNAVMGLGLLCYFAIIFITVGWLGQVSGSYGTFEPVQVPQGLLPDYNQTNAESGFWSSVTTLSSQLLTLIYTFLSFIGRFFAVVSFAVINIPLWLAIILNVMQGGMLIWGFMYLRGNG